jgi:hypothetical protein
MVSVTVVATQAHTAFRRSRRTQVIHMPSDMRNRRDGEKACKSEHREPSVSAEATVRFTRFTNRDDGTTQFR